MDAEWTKVTKVECLGEVDDFVYDISISNGDPFFFANDILVHNTDSCYFSAFPILKNQIETNSLLWNKETCIELYRTLASIVNDSFVEFAEKTFHCPPKNGEIIRANLELIGDRALFITKKRYAINIFESEGKRYDQDDRQGKIKAMGLDLKRADTPKYIQAFLMRILEMVLAGSNRDMVIETIRQFKKELSTKESWSKGSPKSVNNLTYYGSLEKKSKTGKANMPGHVRAALNYNYLREMNGDNYSLRIVDGMKIVVCKLRTNMLGFTSIAYPVDELRLPKWFTELPFDDLEMEKTLVDEKIDNLLSVLGWELRTDTNTTNVAESLFTFG